MKKLFQLDDDTYINEIGKRRNPFVNQVFGFRVSFFTFKFSSLNRVFREPLKCKTYIFKISLLSFCLCRLIIHN